VCRSVRVVWCNIFVHSKGFLAPSKSKTSLYVYFGGLCVLEVLRHSGCRLGGRALWQSVSIQSCVSRDCLVQE
jgi:hypothetical protein